MSLIGKKWVIQNEQDGLGLIEKLLHNRGLTDDASRREFFEGNLSALHDPMLFKGMKQAVQRIREAAERKEKIMVFGDYDVDGITATVILYDFLKRLGADAHYTLPNREEDGYGLKDYFVRQFKEKGVKLIITVDCGISNKNEVDLANQLGVDVIITDHHDIPPELPDACCIINAKQTDCPYPNKELSGSGISYKLVSALAPYFFDAATAERYLYEKLGLATLGLVADCMPLTGENRILTKYGLKSLEKADHPGVAALLDSTKVPKGKINSTTIGFYLGPRINAAGRLDSADHALELLLGKVEKADTLNQLNAQRQKAVESYVKEAKADIEALDTLPPLLVVKRPHWNVGILGLIAGKLTDLFNRPAIAIQEKEDEFVASCRSLNDFDITNFLREEAADLFSAFGGHKLAGGFSLPKPNWGEFIKRVEKAAQIHINPNDFIGTLPIDCEIQAHEISFETCHQINKLEPFGQGNPEPTLMVRNVKLHAIKPVGDKGEHIQMPLRIGEKRVQAIAFRFGRYLDKIDPAATYDIAFNMEINEWKGYKNLQLKVVDLKLSNQ